MFTKILEKITKDKKLKNIIKVVRKKFRRRFMFCYTIKKVLNNLSKNCKEKLITNLIINWMFLGNEKRQEFAKMYGFSPSTLFVISPTMGCDLKCIDCYAGKKRARFKLCACQ